MNIQKSLRGNESFQNLDDATKRDVMATMMRTGTEQLMKNEFIQKSLGFEGDDEGYRDFLNDNNRFALGDQNKELMEGFRERLSGAQTKEEQDELLDEAVTRLNTANTDIFKKGASQEEMRQVARGLINRGQSEGAAPTDDIAARYGATAAEDIERLKELDIRRRQTSGVLVRPGEEEVEENRKIRERLRDIMPQDQLEKILSAQGKGQAEGTGNMANVAGRAAAGAEGISDDPEGAGKARDFADASKAFLEAVKKDGANVAEQLTKLATALDQLGSSTTPENMDNIMSKLGFPDFFGGR
jgi:hypothetical protein